MTTHQTTNTYLYPPDTLGIPSAVGWATGGQWLPSRDVATLGDVSRVDYHASGLWFVGGSTARGPPATVSGEARRLLAGQCVWCVGYD